MSIYSKQFWSATAERAISTVAENAGATLVAAGTGLIGADWIGVASVAGMAGLLAVLKAVAAGRADGNPSIGSLEAVAAPGVTADPVGGEPVAVEADPIADDGADEYVERHALIEENPQ